MEKRRMKAGWMALAVLPALCAFGQARSGNAAATRLLLHPAEQATARPGEEVFREIDDPATGDRWLLLRDTDDPGGPGRMVLAARGLSMPSGSGSIRTSAALAPLLPVIRAGDRVIVEENTPVVEARLEAIALGPAFTGSVFEARLEIGGKVVQAVALGPGRAAFANQIGSRP